MWAADEARLRRRALLIVHSPDAASAARARLSGEPAIRAADDVGHRLLDNHLLAASARQPGVPVTSILSHSSPADALVDLSHDATMLVVGTRGHNGFATTALGSVSTLAAAHAHCPVVIVPEEPALSSADLSLPVVTGVSDSRAGREAFRFAMSEAYLRGVPLFALRSAGPPSGAEPRGLRAIADQSPEVLVEPCFTEQEPTDALLSAAHRAQLLVVGCHHSEDHWSTRMGPVAAGVVHRSPCPVAVVGWAESSTAMSDEHSLALGHG
jgi:nucleotide-binding universal stress UspA family protein